MPDMILRRDVERSRSSSRLPRLFVLGVWSVTIVGFLLLWFSSPLFDLECESPCDGPAYAALGVLELGILVLTVAKLSWIVRARLVQANGPPSDMGALRPVFVWALALIALPMLLLFGVGFVTDIEGPWRIAMAPAYVVEAGPEPSSATVMHPIWGPPLPDTTSADRRLALVSVIIAAIALLANVGLYLMARRAPQLLLLVVFLEWGKILTAVFAILLARQAVRRIDHTRDKRGLMTAQVGLMLGWATIAYVVFGIIIWPVSQVTSNIHP